MKELPIKITFLVAGFALSLMQPILNFKRGYERGAVDAIRNISIRCSGE